MLDKNVEWRTPPEEQLLAVINGIQQNLLLLAAKIDLLEERLNVLSKDKTQAEG